VAQRSRPPVSCVPMTRVKDLLDLPDAIRNNDFVVRLTQEVHRQDHALQDYAVTPGILRAYDQALQIVGAALSGQESLAAYVHGSFGAGKSHFMAVLSLLLADMPAAWTHEALATLRPKHPFVGQKKVLRLHFHMIGAASLEERVLGDYAEQVRELHPEAPLPAFWEDTGVFEDARRLRGDMGDEAFFRKLNEGLSQPADGWGEMAEGARWTAQTFEEAIQSQSREARARLFSVLVRCYFSAYAGRREGFIDIDRGLAVLSAHARSLGYDVIVLFLDELVLWLSSRATDVAWLNSEVQKMVKLVESQAHVRPIPLVSFVARQRDMRQMVGEQFAGVASQNLADSLKWWEGRLRTINLEDRNLPAIIEKRVVRARDEAARRELNSAFDRVKRSLNAQGWDTLRGDDGDEKSFRQVYPFSPALVEALVALSSFLQRERTALKVLVELLVEHMEDFQLGQLMPVGDLFDALSKREEPLDGVMRERFQAARRLYDHELLPLIQTQNQTSSADRCQRQRPEHPPTLGCAGCKQARCRADNRLAKTVLLAALVPETPTLKGLTVSRLVRLNHGMLPQGPIPGRETQDALARIRVWAGEIGKIRLGEGNDPAVSAMLEGVDLKPILVSARGADSEGARRRRVHQLLFRSFEIEHGAAQVEHEVVFYGTKRKGLVHFGNVREMTDEQMQARHGDDFKIIIDYPFDTEGHSPGEDVARVHRYPSKHAPSSTVVWLPSFFGERVMRDLADLVVLDKLRENSEESRAFLAHLRPDDAARARTEIENLASQKENRVKVALEAVYGITEPQDGMQDEARALVDHFHVLTPGLTIRASIGMASNLADALNKAIEQLLDQRFPRHPRFTTLVSTTRLRTAYRRFAEVSQSPGQRVIPAPSDRVDLDAPRGLGLVLVTDSAALVVADRIQEIDAALRRNGVQTPTAEQVKRAADSQGVFGLTPELSDFLVLSWALATNREVRHGGQVLTEAAIGKLPPDAELWLPPLPTQNLWVDALKLLHELTGELPSAGSSFATPAARALHPQNLRLVAEQIRGLRTRLENSKAHQITEALHHRGAFGAASSPRLETAQSAQDLWKALDSKDPVVLVEVLGRFKPRTSAADLRKHIDSANSVWAALQQDLTFQIFAGLLAREDASAESLLEEIRGALGTNEATSGLAANLSRLAVEAQRLLTPIPSAEPRPPERTAFPPPEHRGGGTIGGGGDEVVLVQRGVGTTLAELEQAVEQIRGALKEGQRLLFQWSIQGKK
jgi:hypothetical protein